MNLLGTVIFFGLIAIGSQEMAEHEGERVTVRGFFYHTAEGEGILAGEPNLRTCCVGSEQKKATQLHVRGSTEDLANISSNYVVDVEGVFGIHDGKYMLTETRVIEGKSSWLTWVALLCICISVAIWRYLHW